MTNMKNIVYLSAASLFILISLTYLATTRSGHLIKMIGLLNAEIQKSPGALEVLEENLI